MRLIKLFIVCLAIALTGCASGVKYKDMASSIPGLQAEKGRIYFLRSASMFGAALQPSVMLDGAKVGESKPGGFFFVDRAAGSHEVTTATEVEKKLTFTLDKGEVKYVKTSIGLGLFVGRVIPELINASEAKKELEELSFTGNEVYPQDKGTASAATPRPSQNQTAAEKPADAYGPEKWDGSMACEARADTGQGSGPYQVKFAMEVRGNAVNVHRKTAEILETLSGQVANDTLELRGVGYRIAEPARNWQLTIRGDFQPGATTYSGNGNMLANGKVIRACALKMMRKIPVAPRKDLPQEASTEEAR